MNARNGPHNGEGHPVGQQGGTPKDHQGSGINLNGSRRSMRLVGPAPFLVECAGFEYLEVSEALGGTPLGMAVLSVNDTTELVVLVSARAKQVER